MITSQEREKALGLLSRSRQALLDAVAGVTDAQARWKPAPDRWSILEYVEHLALADDGLVALIHHSLQKPAQAETDEQRRERANRIRATPIPRGANRAPEAFQPGSRFATLADALAAFLAARDRTLEFARSTEDDLRSHFSPHPVLGPMDAYQWLVGNAHHAETHAGHIREIRDLPGFPHN